MMAGSIKPGQRCVVVTGASSGIGLGTVRVLSEAGYHVCGSVRKPDDGQRLCEQFGESFTPLLFDVLDEAAVQKAAAQARLMRLGRSA
jgi:NADP-dependent 3-hydroxy acid dehydrogenase YdfG